MKSNTMTVVESIPSTVTADAVHEAWKLIQGKVNYSFKQFTELTPMPIDNSEFCLLKKFYPNVDITRESVVKINPTANIKIIYAGNIVLIFS